MAKDVLDAVYGCLIGGAIGDALGAPVEGWYHTEIREKYGRLTQLLPSGRTNTLNGPPGTVTDDTTLRHYLCLAIVRKGGRVTPDDFARVWLEVLTPKRLWCNEQLILHKLKAGMSPWDSGRGCIPAGCATMAIAPIGIINAGDPAQAYQDGYNIASVNQDGLERDGAATVAAAFLPGATVETVLQAMVRHSSYVIRRAIELTMDLARASRDVDEFAAQYYARMLDWTWPHPPECGPWNKAHFFSGSSIEIVPVTTALLHLCRGDANQCIVEGASFGRDCDTIGSAIGCIAGALQGASAIRAEWIATVEAANEPFFEEVEGDPQANFHAMARCLVAALGKEKAAAEARARTLGEILR